VSVDTIAARHAWAAGSGRALIAWARDYGIVVILLLICFIFAVTTDTFLTERNLINLAEQSAEPALLACGMTVVIIAGEFDLSVGAILGFAAIAAAFAANDGAGARGLLAIAAPASA
jgi:ribose transport system permease protein